MPQINLLKQKTGSQTLFEHMPAVLLNLIIVVVLILVGFYIFLFLRVKSITNSISTTQTQITQQKASAINNKDREELLARQGQLAAFKSLIAKHVYWSQLFPELAKATLNTATYSDLKALTNGTITMSVSLPTLSDLDKYLEVFDLADFNKNFSDVKMGSLHMSQSGNSTDIKFEVQFKYNPQIIQYRPVVQGQ